MPVLAMHLTGSVVRWVMVGAWDRFRRRAFRRNVIHLNNKDHELYVENKARPTTHQDSCRVIYQML